MPQIILLPKKKKLIVFRWWNAKWVTHSPFWIWKLSNNDINLMWYYPNTPNKQNELVIYWLLSFNRSLNRNLVKMNGRMEYIVYWFANCQREKPQMTNAKRVDDSVILHFGLLPSFDPNLHLKANELKCRHIRYEFKWFN